MISNYDLRYDLNKSASKQFLNYILSTMVGQREPIKAVVVSSESNAQGTLGNAMKGVVHRGITRNSVNEGMLTLKVSIPLGTSGSIKYVQIMSGDGETGQVVETFEVPKIDKLENVNLELTLILMSYSF